jgi:CubicO group peptidase (beta-lactamase class C family)
MEETCKYVYSDIGYYFSKILIEKLTKTTLNNYVQSQFYKPLNLGLTYLPLVSLSC